MFKEPQKIEVKKLVEAVKSGSYNMRQVEHGLNRIMFLAESRDQAKIDRAVE
jgi:hypothetical protein